MWSAQLEPKPEQPLKKKKTPEMRDPFLVERTEIEKKQKLTQAYLADTSIRPHVPLALKKEGVQDYFAASRLNDDLNQQKRDIAFYELKPKEQRALVARYSSLYPLQIGLIPYPAETSRDVVYKEYLELNQKIPRDILITEEMRLRKKYPHTELEENLEKTSRLVIEVGIQALNSYLTTIKQREGKLPTVLIFPETATRPLVYAIAPLIEKIYGKAGEPLPRRVFVKTHRIAHTFEPIKDEAASNYQKLLKEKTDLIEKRAQLMRSFRASGSRDAASMHHIQLLKEKIDSLTHTFKKNAEANKFFKTATEKDFAEKMQEPILDRIKEIVEYSPVGPYLVIEDLVSEGATLRSIDRAMKTHDTTNAAYYFTFYALKTDTRDLHEIDTNHIYAGITADSQMPAHTTTKDSLLNTEYHEWGEFGHRGFPYRFLTSTKEPNLLVTKSNRYFDTQTIPSPNPDRAAARALRLKYRGWGEESVQNFK